MTCGTGSLLLKAANEAPHGITIYGQENDNATRALAVMNMWLHGNPASLIVQGNTLASPQFTDETTGELKTFDYAVANPPFSYKSWTNGWILPMIFINALKVTTPYHQKRMVTLLFFCI
jgi:type I restriction enzyme M protein